MEVYSQYIKYFKKLKTIFCACMSERKGETKMVYIVHIKIKWKDML